MHSKGMIGFLVVAAAGLTLGVALSQGQRAIAQPGGGGGGGGGGGPLAALNNLPETIAGVEGCLGVETAQTSSGKNVIFAWFEDKAAVERWYYHPMHQGAMKSFFPQRADDQKPLEGVADDSGPLMVIASITMNRGGQGDFEETQIPISQISIEIYAPVKGGIFLGETFAPMEMDVEGMRDVTPPGMKE